MWQEQQVTLKRVGHVVTLGPLFENSLPKSVCRNLPGPLHPHHLALPECDHDKALLYPEGLGSIPHRCPSPSCLFLLGLSIAPGTCISLDPSRDQLPCCSLDTVRGFGASPVVNVSLHFPASRATCVTWLMALSPSSKPDKKHLQISYPFSRYLLLPYCCL